MSTVQKIALVTGGSRGLGKDMAISMARGGIDVILTYRNKENEALETVNEITSLGGKAVALQLDMGDVRSLDDFVQLVRERLQAHWGKQRFDFLVNNAGMGATVPFLEVTEEVFDDFLNVHFKAVYFLTQKKCALYQ